MPLDDPQAKWLFEFTAGALVLPRTDAPAQGSKEDLEERLRVARGKEVSEEQALKNVLLTKAFAVLDKEKEAIRKACDLVTETEDESGKRTKAPVKDPRGRQEKAFDSKEAPRLTKAPTGKDKGDDGRDITPIDATQAYSVLVKQKDKLAAEMVERSFIDERNNKIGKQPEPLFSDTEIMEELYTPLVRELVVPETFVEAKYSATQKMMDGSNDYYIKECREKGKSMKTGAADLAKGAIQLGATVATTVLGAMAPVKDGQTGLPTSGKMTKFDMQTATDITNGIAATLTGLVDVVDQVDDFRETGDISTAGFKTVMNGVAAGVGKIVAGATGNQNFGLAVTDSISAAASGIALIPMIAEWRRKGGAPPWGDIVDTIGGAIASGLSAKSDLTSDAGTSTQYAQAGVVIGAAFSTFAKAAEVKVVEAMRQGEWDKVFEVLAAAGRNAAKAVPVAVTYAAQYNAIGGAEDGDSDEVAKEKNEKQYGDQQLLIKAMSDLNAGLDKTGPEAEKLFAEGVEKIYKKFGLTPPKPQAKQVQEGIDAKFAEVEEQKAKEVEAEQAKELKSIEAALKKEQEEYKKSLVCLGSDNPDDADFKTIAKLVAQLERDRAIWDAMFALFGGAIGAGSAIGAAAGVAAEVAPPLKIAGQLVKYCANLKAAADRLEAWLDWKESQKDSISAVSPYATSVDNFVKNQGQQFTHYTLQAAAAAIQALLAAGEMSPVGPAFKIAGAGVALAATAEEMVYKFYKAQALRTAWGKTKEALDPKNAGNRKMALLVREINPTLAKYTLAYGALIAGSPVAITAMSRCGLDRETLARAGQNVKDVKDYLEKLYRDDGTAMGVLAASAGKTKLPNCELTSKAWGLTYLLLEENEGLATPNPPAISTNLALAEALLKKDRKTFEDEEYEQLTTVLAKLWTAFAAFDPRDQAGEPKKQIKAVAAVYADLAQAKAEAIDMERTAAANAVAQVATMAEQGAKVTV